MADGGTDAPVWLAPLERALRPWLRRLWRGSISRDALLTLDEAASLVHGNDAEVTAWIRLNVPPRRGPCGELWLWGDILDATRAPAPKERPRAPVAVPAGLTRGSY